MVLQGGAPATAAHYGIILFINFKLNILATILGRADILKLLIKNNVSVTTSVEDQLGNHVTPFLIASKNSFNHCKEVLAAPLAISSGRKTVRLSTGGNCIIN